LTIHPLTLTHPLTSLSILFIIIWTLSGRMTECQAVSQVAGMVQVVQDGIVEGGCPFGVRMQVP
jgi:hypothetical protein